MFNTIKSKLFGTSTNTIGKIQAENSKLLKQNISELEKFNSQELPNLMKSNEEALKGLEQAAKNMKALMNKNIEK